MDRIQNKNTVRGCNKQIDNGVESDATVNLTNTKIHCSKPLVDQVYMVESTQRQLFLVHAGVGSYGRISFKANWVEKKEKLKYMLPCKIM